MSENRVEVKGLQYSQELHEFLVNEALPGSGVEADAFFEGMAAVIEEFTPRQAALLERREEIQSAIDAWHRGRAGKAHDASAYRAFLEELGYLVAPGPPFEIETANVDAEMSTIPGPQLVVPVTNARYVLNAANARWGSLYDALYGTDAMGDTAAPGPYDSARGARVVAWAREFLDASVPLATGSHADAVSYRVIDGALAVELSDNSVSGLAEPQLLVGYSGEPGTPEAILVEHNGLGIEILIDPSTEVGSQDPAGVTDIVLESAVTTIVDCEDSVAAVDGHDKTVAYSNWLGLMKGDLTEEITKGDRTFTRSLNSDRVYTGADGSPVSRPGRSLMLTRNVGHLMRTPAVLDAGGNEIFEGLLDAMVTVLCARHDLNRTEGDRNTRTGSVYVVKPKMHGPEEVTHTVDVFAKVEQILGLAPETVKIGIMDEERRTTVNLAECVRAAKSRVCFINTGFLDRTGDEIHTSMQAGPMIPKGKMKSQPWISAYEDHNVDVGLACGLLGKAQIGKGMWAMPNLMAAMLEQKVGHPRSGATCAWVPSPTAATLHATHYHQVDVLARQAEILAQIEDNGPRGSLEDILTIPLAEGVELSDEEIQAELDNNAQGILGYVVRWVDQGVGCSTVPDINDVGLMEDRATCRISSQHMANWLHHGVVDVDRVTETFKRMAEVVDRQNADDAAYVPMAPGYDGHAFKAACDLVLSGVEQPSGYTEPILHARRLQFKGQM